MKIVIDTNLLFSAVLKKESKIKSILLDKRHDFYSCNFAFVELFKHIERVSRESKLTQEQIINQLKTVLGAIFFVKEEMIPREIFDFAFALCGDVDENDTPFVALTIFLGAKLFTGDKKLMEALSKKGFNEFVTINELEGGI